MLVPWLRRLGFRADEARRAAALCETIPNASLEERGVGLFSSQDSFSPPSGLEKPWDRGGTRRGGSHQGRACHDQ